MGKSAKKAASEQDVQNSTRTLNVLLDSWDFTESRKEMRDDLVAAITEVSKNGNWSKDDIERLEKAQKTLSANGYNDQAEIISTKITELRG